MDLKLKLASGQSLGKLGKIARFGVEQVWEFEVRMTIEQGDIPDEFPLTLHCHKENGRLSLQRLHHQLLHLQIVPPVQSGKPDRYQQNRSLGGDHLTLFLAERKD